MIYANSRKRVQVAKGSDNSRSLLRLLFWEGMALIGFLHILRYPNANPLWSLHFHYNAIVFLIAYPLLYVYRWKMADGFLGLVMWPVSILLSWGLGVSAYLCITYWLQFSGSPYTGSLMNHWLVLGALFIFIYFPLIQPVLGTSQKYFSLGPLLVIFFYSGLGGFLGLLLGKFVDGKYGVSIGNNRFLLWLSLILIGTAVGALAARKQGKD